MLPRSEAEAADAHELVDLCLGDRAPYGLIEFFTGAAATEEHIASLHQDAAKL